MEILSLGIIEYAAALFITGCVFLWWHKVLNRVFSIGGVRGLLDKFSGTGNILKKGLDVSLVSILASQLFLATPAIGGPSGEKQKENAGDRMEKPIWEELPRRITRDFKHVYAVPRGVDRKDWLKFSGVLAATGLLIAYDGQVLDSVKSEDEVGGFLHQVKPLGDAKFSVPALLSVYAIGFLVKSEREKETAIRGIEALAIAGLTTVSIQAVTGRQRPEDGGKFEWFEYGHFPSGHTIMAFALAPIFDYQYCRVEKEDSNPEKLVKYLGKGVIYGLPSAVAYERLKSGSHYPSDVFASMVLALSIGNMVNRLDEKEQRSWMIGPHVGESLAGFKVSFCW